MALLVPPLADPYVFNRGGGEPAAVAGLDMIYEAEEDFESIDSPRIKRTRSLPDDDFKLITKKLLELQNK